MGGWYCNSHALPLLTQILDCHMQFLIQNFYKSKKFEKVFSNKFFELRDDVISRLRGKLANMTHG